MRKKLIRLLYLALMLPVLPVLGAIKVKSIESSAEKWSGNASRASAEMATNAEAAAEEWARNTAAAADNFGMAISAAGIKERFRRGVVKAGAAKFARKVKALAASRFSEGVGAARDDYTSGAGPFFSTIAGLTLSPRKPRGDPSNYRRVEEIGKALNAKRLALLGGGGG